MSFFDRIKKKSNSNSPSGQWPKSPRSDTMCLVLMDRVLEDICLSIKHLKAVFGNQAVSEVDYDHPQVPAFTVTIDGFEFWCSYLPMPVPTDTADIPTSAQYSYLLTDEEKQEFINHKSFWMLGQKGGGMSLEAKREVCWKFSMLNAALLEQEGAIGVHILNRGGLLISKCDYIQQRERMEGIKPSNEEGFFPVFLWVWVFGTTSDNKYRCQTMGLRDFGLPELGFFNPKQYTDEELLDFLYMMSGVQITGQHLYQNATLVSLDENTEVVCKQDGDVLFFIGA